MTNGVSLKNDAIPANPEIINEIVEQTASAFLLVIVHAPIAVIAQNPLVTTYVEKLPLDKTEQIPVGGVRKENGRLRVAQGSMSPEGYQLLELILGKWDPTVLTLECSLLEDLCVNKYYVCKDNQRRNFNECHVII